MCRRSIRCALIAGLALALSSLSFAAKTRHYYIAAEDATWDYAPSGRDLIHGMPIPEPWSTQTKWVKTRYFEYTDATFSTRKPQPAWLGILGPIIRAEVGDTILVEFLNRTEQIHSIHPHGLRYDKDNEGSAYLPYGKGAGIAPGERYTYRWVADKSSGPGADGPSSVVWWYHSHVDAEHEINAGLLGPIIITAAGMADAQGRPKDVNREFVVLFMIFDELHGKDAGMFHSMNGFIFGNLPELLIKQGEHVRWHLLSMGNEKDLHTPHWHGKVVDFAKRHTDVIELLPGSMATADMTADNPGTWMFHCHVADHMEAGMMATYTIYEPPPSCPVRFAARDWEQMSGAATLEVKNASLKPIRSISVLSGYLVNVQELQPLILTWFSNAPMKPGRSQEVTIGKEMFSDGGNLGVAFFPSSVVFEDGTEWKPRHLGECFRVYWREGDHPDLPVLPPFQFKQKED
jgi:Multicopper oxidase